MMKLVEILNLANEAYPGGFLSNYYDENGRYRKGHGDLLAECIVLEIISSYNSNESSVEQLQSALRVLETMTRDVEDVWRHLLSQVRNDVYASSTS
jgi:hypothetical protein